MYVPFHLLKNLHQESFSIFYFFSPSHLKGNNNGNHDPRGGEFCKILFLLSWFAKLFLVLPKLYRCQVGAHAHTKILAKAGGVKGERRRLPGGARGRKRAGSGSLSAR
jgi:hypothetical protein